MINEENRKPKIRFKGFEDEWKQRQFGDVFEEYCEKNHEELPPLTIIQGGGTILREKSERNLQYDKSSLSGYKMVRKDDFIVHLRSFEGGLEKANSDGIISPAYFTFHGNDTDSRFYYPFFRSRHFIDVLLKPHVYGIRDGKSIDIDGMKTIQIPVPPYPEQKKIGEYIESLDKLMLVHQREIDRLVCVRKAMIEKMFPHDSMDVPEVRFEGYTGPWRWCQFSEIFTERRSSDTISEEYPQLSFTIEEGVIRPEDRKTNRRDFLILDKTNKRYLQTEYDDIIYNPANVVFGAIHRNALGKGCVSPIYKIFYTDQDSAFMECIVRHPRFIKEISRSMEGTVKKLRTLKPKAFLEMSAYIAPTKDEQKQIGVFFKQMDSLIEIEKEELEKIKHIKSACLEKMFV